MSKILMVEDDNILAKAISTVLSGEGYEVVRAMDGEDGLEKLKKFLPDLILLDLIMPKKSGEEFLAEIKKSAGYKDIPVLVSTVKSDTESISRCMALGISGYFIKAHYSLDDIIKEVKKIIG
jgi:CheY-like chemotaxis protein